MAQLALAFDILARDKASKEFRQVAGAADQAGESGSRFGSAMKRGMAVAATAIAGAAVAAGAGLKEAVSEASDLGESINAVNVTFGDAADGVLKLSENSATAVGLSKSEFNSLAVQFSSFATTIAGQGGDVAATLGDLTGRAADFASVMDLDVNEATSLFQSGLAGESEPLRKFGIDLSAAAVEAYAMAEGIGTSGKALTENEKVQARYGLLMEKTSKTQGDFANTSDSLANRQRILGATIDDIQATIGGLLLPALEDAFGYIGDTVIPVVQRFVNGMEDGTGAGGRFRERLNVVKDAAVDAFSYFKREVLPILQRLAGFITGTLVPAVGRIIRFFNDNRGAAVALTGTIAALVAITRVHATVMRVQAAGGLLAMLRATKLVTTATRVFTAVQWLLNLALRANPIGIVITVLTALVAGIVIAYKRSDTFRNAVNKVWAALKVAGNWIKDTGGKIKSWLIDRFADAAVKVNSFINKIKSITLPKWIYTLRDMIGSIAGGLKSGAGKLAGFFGIGDAPGSFQGTVIGGGKALARVQSVLPSGLRITSTYRSPSHNARVGGSPTSKHMDRNNPAVDIGGPTYLLDRFAAQLAAMGGWRQLLWRVAGHYDHIHVAHSGGKVSSSWPRMPGDRWDERTARLQVGETVVPRGGSERSFTFNVRTERTWTPAEALGLIARAEALYAV